MMNLLQGDCLELMQGIPDGSVDMVLTDPPYGTTACKWDSIIDLPLMWAHLKRIIKPNGAIVMTASQPFTTTLIASNMKMFKYCWVWKKSQPTGTLFAKFQPMRITEDVVVFSGGKTPYNPQMTERTEQELKKFSHKSVNTTPSKSDGRKYNKTPNRSEDKFKHPNNHIDIKSVCNRHKGQNGHPTQKPVALMEYLIKTYTNEGETVLDFTMGSGTTGVACKRLGRKFIGIEKDDKYFQIAKDRIENGG
jgi:site-specific DNA-methyltransferase (adenine-specific)